MFQNLLLTYYPCAFPMICIQTEKWNINNNNSNNYVTINIICHNYRKQCKHQKLAFKIRKQWQLNMIIVTPLVSSTMAVNPNMLNQSPTNFILLPCLVSQVQRFILDTCSIMKIFLSDEVHLPDEETKNHQSGQFTVFSAMCTHFNIP